MDTEEFFREHGYYPTTYVPRLNTRRPTIKQKRVGTKPAPVRHAHGWDSYTYVNTAVDLRLVRGFNLLVLSEQERKPPCWQNFERLFITDDLPEDPLEDLLDRDLLGVPIGYKSVAAQYLSLQEQGEWLDFSLEDFIGVMESLEAFETDDLGDELPPSRFLQT